MFFKALTYFRIVLFFFKKKKKQNKKNEANFTFHIFIVQVCGKIFQKEKTVGDFFGMEQMLLKNFRNPVVIYCINLFFRDKVQISVY